MGDRCPWEARELDPQEPYNEKQYPSPTTRVWLMKTSTVEKKWLTRWRGRFNISFGSLTCLGQKFCNVPAKETPWWGSPKYTEPNPYPLSNFTHLRQAWDNVATEIE